MDVQVVVADNASTDGSLEMLAELFPAVRTIALNRNYGFAEGYNRALRQIEADYYMLLNSDVEVPMGWLDPLVEWMDLHKDCGICGPKLHQIDRRDTFEYAGAAGGYIDIFGYPFCRGRVMHSVETDCGQYEIPTEVFWVSGAALMIRSELFHALDGFCGRFFAHMEEIDLCWRARLKGSKVCVVPRSTVYHVGGGALPQDSPFKLELNYRNNLLMLHRNLPSTLALYIAFNTLANAADRDEGPDFLEVSRCICDENGKTFTKDLCRISADAGLSMARSIIFVRRWLDRLSAIVYLFQGKPQCFKAVHKAHREFRKMKKDIHGPGVKQIRRNLHDVMSGERMDIARNILTDNPDCGNAGNGEIKIKGIWKKFMILRFISQKNDIFKEIKDNLI